MKPSLAHHLGTTALVVLLATGCSKLPTEPVVGGLDDLQGAVRGAETAAVNPSAYATGGDAPVWQLIDAPTTVTEVIYGKTGGTLAVGDFSLVAPPEAWRGKATVTMTQADRSQAVVELGISPASKNNFEAPVTLVVNISRVNPIYLKLLRLSAFDATTGQWTAAAGATVNTQNKTMSIPLSHFSKYRVEIGNKVGW